MTPTATTPTSEPPARAAMMHSILDGDSWAYLSGLVAVLLGGAVVYSLFPRHRDELRLPDECRRIDTGARDDLRTGGT